MCVHSLCMSACVGVGVVYSVYVWLACTIALVSMKPAGDFFYHFIFLEKDDYRPCGIAKWIKVLGQA